MIIPELTGKKGRVIAIILLVAMGCFFASDMYVPSMPAIAQALHTSPQLVECTIAVYLLDFALLPLFFGPLSDRYGRRSILLFGLALAIVGSFVCVFAPTISILLVGRFIQGGGAGIAAALTRTLLRDCFVGSSLARVGSYFSLAMSIAPAIAPAVGGYTQLWFGWQAAFIVITGIFIGLISVVYFLLPETVPKQVVQVIRAKVIISNYLLLLKNKWFMTHAYFTSAAFSGMILYYTLGPFLFEKGYGFSAVTFGWLSLLITLVNIFSRVLNVYLVVHRTTQQIIHLGLLMMGIAGVFLLLMTLLHLHAVSLIILATACYVLGGALVFSNALTQAFTPFGHVAGNAGALYGSLQVFGGFIVSDLAAHVLGHSQLTLAVLYGFLGCSSLLLYYWFVVGAETADSAAAPTSV